MKMENKELRQRLADDAALWQDLQHDLTALNSMPEGKGRRQQVSQTSVNGASSYGLGRVGGARVVDVQRLPRLAMWGGCMQGAALVRVLLVKYVWSGLC